MLINTGANQQKCLKKTIVFFSFATSNVIKKMGCKHDQIIRPFFDPLPSIPVPNLETIQKRYF